MCAGRVNGRSGGRERRLRHDWRGTAAGWHRLGDEVQRAEAARAQAFRRGGGQHGDLAAGVGEEAQQVATPNELEIAMEQAGLSVTDERGVVYNPLADAWRLSSDTDVNYMLAAEKA